MPNCACFTRIRRGLCGPISRDIAILSLRYPISRDAFPGRLAAPQNGAISPGHAIPPFWALRFTQALYICAISHLATYRAIIGQYPAKTSTKKFCDTIATSIVRYENYRCWASKGEGGTVQSALSALGARPTSGGSRKEELRYEKDNGVEGVHQKAAKDPEIKGSRSQQRSVMDHPPLSDCTETP